MNLTPQLHSCAPHDLFHFVLKWTPRAIIAGLAGYYSLGIAYDKGLMAAIDRIAIYIFRHTFGFVGMGAFMPSFQWYSAWAVRIVAAFAAGILYDLAERVAIAAYRNLMFLIFGEAPLNPAPVTRAH